MTRKSKIIITLLGSICALSITAPVGQGFAAVKNGKIAFTSDRDGAADDIYTMDSDGSNVVRLTDDPAEDANPVWSPDGSQLMFSSLRNGNYDIYTLQSDGSGLKQITSNSALEIGIDWSPDGSKILLYSKQNNNTDVYTVNSDGSEMTRLTEDAASDVASDWSADGSKILFYSLRDGNREIYTMNADGTDETRLTDYSQEDTGAKWSPDGQRILYSSDLNTSTAFNREITIMNADGTGKQNLSQMSLTDEQRPEWSPEGDQIVFESNYSGGREIFKMKADGSLQTRLTVNDKFDAMPSWQTLTVSDDGEVKAPVAPPTDSAKVEASKPSKSAIESRKYLFELTKPRLNASRPTLMSRARFARYLATGFRGTVVGYKTVEASLLKTAKIRSGHNVAKLRCYELTRKALKTSCRRTSVDDVKISGSSFNYRPAKASVAAALTRSQPTKSIIQKGRYLLVLRAISADGSSVSVNFRIKVI